MRQSFFRWQAATIILLKSLKSIRSETWTLLTAWLYHTSFQVIFWSSADCQDEWLMTSHWIEFGHASFHFVACMQQIDNKIQWNHVQFLQKIDDWRSMGMAWYGTGSSMVCSITLLLVGMDRAGTRGRSRRRLGGLGTGHLGPLGQAVPQKMDLWTEAVA